MGEWLTPTPFEVVPTQAAQIGDLHYHIDSVASEIFEQYPVTQDGTIVAGSYDPIHGTAECLWGDTYAIIGDDGTPGDAYINHQKLAILTTQPGDLYGPTGIERTSCFPTPAGYGLLYVHGSDDSPMPPPGERWILHKSKATFTKPQAIYDTGQKFRNWALATNDGLGGLQVGYKGQLTQMVTQSYITGGDTQNSALGHQITCNDVLQKIYTVTTNGMTGMYDDVAQYIFHAPAMSGNPLSGGIPTLGSILDVQGTLGNAANSISHLIPAGGLIGLGTQVAGSLSPTFAAMNQDIMNTQYSNLLSTFQLDNLVSYFSALSSALTLSVPSFNASAFLTKMGLQIVAGWITGIGNVTGSQYVRVQT